MGLDFFTSPVEDECAVDWAVPKGIKALITRPGFRPGPGCAEEDAVWIYDNLT